VTWRRFVSLSAGLWLGSVAPAAAQLVLDASPTVKVESSMAKTTRFALSKKEQIEYRLTIVQREGRYYWASRKNTELVLHRASDAVHFFIALNGAGYVKVIDTLRLPEAIRPEGLRFRYVEHMGLLDNTITYWGASEEFHLPTIASEPR
jgi:hypothetical protein